MQQGTTGLRLANSNTHPASCEPHIFALYIQSESCFEHPKLPRSLHDHWDLLLSIFLHHSSGEKHRNHWKIFSFVAP